MRRIEIGGGGRLEHGPLLDALEADLRRGHEFGSLVADLLLLLGLFGIVLAFILMVGLTEENAIQGQLAAMSDTMRVALYIGLAGLVGGALLKMQCFVLERAVRELVGRTIRLTEAFVLPAIQRSRLPPTIERMRRDAAA